VIKIVEFKYPDRVEASDILLKAYYKNPGVWREHSYNVGRAAEKIAEVSDMDSDYAYTLGLLHDVGRYKGKYHIRHVIDGYELMLDAGYDSVAKVCLTHSFPIKDIRCYSGKIDCTQKEYDSLCVFLKEVIYDDYDLLIQLCDAISLPDGITILEKRFYDVVSRHGVNKLLNKKWEEFFNIKNYFDNKSDGNIYNLFKDEIINGILE